MGYYRDEMSKTFDIELNPGRSLSGTKARVKRVKRYLRLYFEAEVLDTFVKPHEGNYVTALMRIRFGESISLQDAWDKLFIPLFPEIRNVQLPPKAQFGWMMGVAKAMQEDFDAILGEGKK